MKNSRWKKIFLETRSFKSERIFLAAKKITKNAFVSVVYLICVIRIIESETLQITTYYPAPYGAYASILTTGNTFLARDWGNVGIGTQFPSFKLDVQGGSVRIGGRLSTQNYDPDRGYPPGWWGGIHTWDVYAEGTLGAGQGGRLASWINAWGDGGVSRDFTIGRNLWVTGTRGGFCTAVYYNSNGWTICPWDYPRLVGFLPDGNWNSYNTFIALDTRGFYTIYRMSNFSTGWMICCRIMY